MVRRDIVDRVTERMREVLAGFVGHRVGEHSSQKIAQAMRDDPELSALMDQAFSDTESAHARKVITGMREELARLADGRSDDDGEQYRENDEKQG